MKKNWLYTVIIMGFLGFAMTHMSSCKAKEGCGLEEKYGPNTNRDGSLSTKRGSSNLFSKKQRKKARS